MAFGELINIKTKHFYTKFSQIFCFKSRESFPKGRKAGTSWEDKRQLNDIDLVAVGTKLTQAWSGRRDCWRTGDGNSTAAAGVFVWHTQYLRPLAAPQLLAKANRYST